MAAVALFRNAKGMLAKIADCFVTMLNQADMLGQLDSMRRSLYDSFDECEKLKPISPACRKTFVTVVISLRHDLYKIKVALLTMNANVQG